MDEGDAGVSLQGERSTTNSNKLCTNALGRQWGSSTHWKPTLPDCQWLMI
jgi:hypothetical protein